MKKNETLSFSRRNLPHWRVAGRPYFVTFRLKNTLPEHIVREMKIKRQKLKNMNKHPDDILSFERISFMRIENILDSQNDSTCYLNQPAAADVVMESFNFIENKYKWHFPYIVVMPSHVHCLASHQDKALISLERVLGHLKSFTSHEINKIIQRKGSLWEGENFDHWCRAPESEERIKEYIRNNPVKAGLVKTSEEWKWMKIEE